MYNTVLEETMWLKKFMVIEIITIIEYQGFFGFVGREKECKTCSVLRCQNENKLC